ncbi:MAG: ACP S-malonyltransferase [Acidobacteriaceae bacterium]
MNVAFLFPGQGSQAVGMGRELAERYPSARRTFEEADDALGYALSTLCWEGPEVRLRMTEVTQPAILTVSVATWRILQEHGVKANSCAGHSLGEYSAYVAAGTLSFTDAVRTVRDRGKYMQEAVPAGEGAMAAVLGLDATHVTSVCEQASEQSGQVVSAANFNAPTQIVISGAKLAVDAALPLLKDRGARKVMPLPVSAPFHCALMQPAQDRLGQDLRIIEFKDALVPVITNVEAAPCENSRQARELLIRQVTGAVRWVEVEQRMISDGAEIFVEVGPGKVLCGLMRQLDKAQRCLNVENEASLQAALEVLRGNTV